MREIRIYTPQNITVGTKLVLEEKAANHIARVLRLKVNQIIHLFNGNGGAWLCEITETKKSHVSVFVKTAIKGDKVSPLKIHLGQGLSRGERMDYVIQKATELGAASITPLITQRCEVRLNNLRTEKRLQHWQQVAISASEQCGRNILPVINPPLSLINWITTQQEGLKLVLHPGEHKKLSYFSKPELLTLLIGPEGGLTSDEIVLAESKQFNCISFGPRILRTETAPTAAISVAQFLWGDCG